ncbi:MAG: hypothetical protein M3126_05035 [Candidatus Eremiobacteraeota bacterium]|nr:hypothetical protein [Candidatus Eremiobacteraeota bacterium]
MKYVCQYCGTQLPVDRDIDTEAYFSSFVTNHGAQCPRQFPEDRQEPQLSVRTY